jgi:hypothetical protein
VPAVEGRATVCHYLTGACPQCGFPLEKHGWALFATTVSSKTNEPRLKKFFEKAKLEVVFRLDGERATWKLCGQVLGGGLMLILRSPSDLFDSDELYMRENMSADAMRRVGELVPAQRVAR